MADDARRGSTGFTLIEILAVLVIIGIVTVVAVISLRALSGRDDAGKTAEHLAGLIQLADENARMENIQYGLRIRRHRYEFMRFTGSQWQPITNDPVLAAHQVPAGIVLDIHTQGQITIPVAATAPQTIASAAAITAAAALTAGAEGGGTAQQAAAQTGAPEPPPQVAILSTGEMTPFTLTLTTTGGTVYVVRGDGNGQIHVQAPGANAPAAATG